MKPRTTILHPWRHRRLLPALLLGAAALLGAGCLPSAEDTLGEEPIGQFTVTYSFDNSSDLDNFTQLTPVQSWTLCTDATDCLTTGGDYPAIRSPNLPASVQSCIELAPDLVTSRISFDYANNVSTGGALQFLIDDVPESSYPTTVGNILTQNDISVTVGLHVYRWCVFDTAPSAYGFLDNITFGAD